MESHDYFTRGLLLGSINPFSDFSEAKCYHEKAENQRATVFWAQLKQETKNVNTKSQWAGVWVLNVAMESKKK